MLSVRTALLATACLTALLDPAQGVLVTNLTTGEVLFRDTFEGVASYNGPFAPGSGDFDPVALVGTWDMGAFGGEDDEPVPYDIQVVNVISPPDPGPFAGSHYLRVDRENAVTGAFARFAPQSAVGQTLQFDMMLATSHNYNSSGGMLSLVDNSGHDVAVVILNNGNVVHRRHGVNTNVATGLTHAKGDWMNVRLTYTLGEPTFDLMIDGNLASGLDLFLAPGVTPNNIAGLRLAGGSRVGGTTFGTLYADSVVTLPTLLVDRQTGQVTLTNNADLAITNIVGYSLLSASGALDPDNWTTVTGHYDAGGDGSFDTAAWSVLSSPTSTEELSEVAFTGEGATLAPGESLELGHAWKVGSDQDVVLQLIIDDGSATGELFTIAAKFGPDTHLPGDFNADGVVNAADYTVWRNNLGGSESVLSGNGSGDSVVDIDDYLVWRSHFGATASAAMAPSIATVPEPGGMSGCLGSAAILVARRKRRSAETCV
jgi:hypothetical protein